MSLPLDINLMMKSNEVMIMLTQMNPENTMLSLNNQTHKTTHCVSTVIYSHQDRGVQRGTQHLRLPRVKEEATPQESATGGHRIAFGEDEDV